VHLRNVKQLRPLTLLQAATAEICSKMTKLRYMLGYYLGSNPCNFQFSFCILGSVDLAFKHIGLVQCIHIGLVQPILSGHILQVHFYGQ